MQPAQVESPADAVARLSPTQARAILREVVRGPISVVVRGLVEVSPRNIPVTELTTAIAACMGEAVGSALKRSAIGQVLTARGEAVDAFRGALMAALTDTRR